MSPTSIRRLRWIAGGVGLALLTAGAFAYPLGLSRSTGLSLGKVVLVVPGLALLAAAILGRHLGRAYRGAAILLLNTLVLLTLLEGAVRLAPRILPRSAPEAEPGSATLDLGRRYVGNGRESLPYYQQQSWSRAYWREYHQVWDGRRLPFRPYTLWRSGPFAGEHLRIDERGLRHTPDAACDSSEAFEVFVFGGSTVWGTGVPDRDTLPARLQQILQGTLERPVCVINLGEQAWVSTQGLIQLLFELKAGRVPDLVIFYDGNNDVFSGYQSGQGGMPQNLDRLEARFEQRDQVVPWRAVLAQSRLYRATQDLGQRVGLPASGAGGHDLEAMAGVVTRSFDTLQQLADAYGFEAFGFWQTALLVTAKPLTPEEAGIRAIAVGVYPGFQELYRATNLQIVAAAAERPRLLPLLDVFDQQQELVFIDPFHVTAEGNQRLARSIADALGEALP